MSVSKETVIRIAHLARLSLLVDEEERMCEEINRLLAFDEQLNEVDIEGIEPLISLNQDFVTMREDEVTAGGDPEKNLANSCFREENFFLVPKVVE